VRERLFRGDGVDHARSRREDFDPIAEGKRYGLAPEVSAALWEHVRREATNSEGVCDENAARERFAQLAELIARRGGQLGPEPFHWTQIDVASGRLPPGNLLAERVPGRTTLVLAETSARARVALGVPGRTTLVAQHVASEVGSLDDSQGFFRRYVSGGHAARAKLERAIVARDHHAAVAAVGALKQDLALARRHFANGLEQDEGLRAELAALEGPAEQLLAKLPNMSGGGRPWELWGPSSAEWRAAIGDDAERADGVSQADARVDEPPASQRLPASLQGRMERAFDRRFDDVELHRDSAEVPVGQLAITRGRRIHLERGAVDLKAARGELVLAHELAHVAQQDGRGERTGTRRELEREAAQAATRAVRGHTTRIALRAEPTAAYAFSEDHEHELDHSATGEATRADPSDARVPTSADTHESAKHEGSEPASQAEPGGALSAASVAEVSAVVPAEDTPGAAPSVGGGPAAKPQKEPPNVAAAKPEHGFSQLRGVRPDKLGPVLGEVHTAASTDVAAARAAQHANPPKQMSTGAAAQSAKGATPDAAGKGAAPKHVTAKDAAPKDAPPVTAAMPAAKDAADRPVKGEVPGGEATKQATQGAAVEQQKTASEVITQVAQTITSWFGSWNSWFGHDVSASAAKMSDEESRQMAGSVDKIPTTTAGVSTDTGPAPELAMKGEARTGADRDRAAFEAKTASLETQGRGDSRAPMGEDHIESTAPPEELTAMSLVAGMPAATPATAMPTLASAPSEEVGIVAQEQHGAEVDAALAKASADVSVERGKHAEHEAQARAESDAQLRELKTQADTDQAAARDAAHAEVGAARAQWQTEIDNKGADARKQGDKKVAEGMAQVEAEETKANAEAKRHIEEGRQKADQEKQKGEKEAADAKEKAKHKSSGFWGWVSSKAKAAFDGVKKAVSSAIDACRRAVKAVIEGAKKLAMAAIELARKAINAAIKAIGTALLALSDVLLAAFPELKARFQGAIRKAVDKATAAVNRLADGLKQAVQKALDRLGSVLDQALQLLEKGINAIIDVANAVVQGAIKAAQAVVEMLGTWAKLIKDVVAGPGTWLGKLGSAVVDGIKNHLWSAFKTTVVEWFKSKVFELLGIGGIVLELLLEGGLTREHILEMAMDALLVAIPAALVAILVEKLVSMIVPAAGALMAIIEGLQAAWGTISRIIAAFAAFMAFLLAVKSGGAGPLFAAVLAGAAVVVLDFVSNWLLKKLASAARKVGAKLKGLAEKFKTKRKAKHDAKVPKTHHEGHGEHHEGPGDHDQRSHDERKKKEEKDKKNEETAAQKQARLDAAVAEVKGLMSKHQRLSLLLHARLLLIRRKFKLDKLEGKKKGSANEWDIFAKVNPEARFDLFSIEDDASDLRKAVGGRLKSLPTTATIFDVKRLCTQAASSHLAPGYKLDWQDMRDSWVLFLERPSHAIPRTAVGEFRKSINYTEIRKEGDQTLFEDGDKKQYVHDSAGQYVPRILTRNISAQDKKALRQRRGIEPTANRRNLEPKEHVMGFKPSPYVSTTKLDGEEVENPHGDMLGGEHGTVRIDLLLLSPKKILDLSTRHGQNTWDLSNPTFKKGAKATTSRQALEDVVRTQEVLIKGEIPYEAIEQL
jgi:hypothetical protein